jgi:hypothetical protein
MNETSKVRGHARLLDHQDICDDTWRGRRQCSDDADGLRLLDRLGHLRCRVDRAGRCANHRETILPIFILGSDCRHDAYRNGIGRFLRSLARNRLFRRFAVTLFLVVATIAIWYWTLGSVAIQTVDSPKVEGFYWAAIMFSQTLGTALGDWIADDTGLGYNSSALVIAGVLAIIAILYFFTPVSRTLLFWAAFVLTRPLGATVANSFDKPVSQAGLAVSDLKASAVLTVLIVISILLIPQRAARQVTDTASP